MDATVREILAAREALVRAAAQIARLLEAEPVWLALRQLDESIGQGHHLSAIDEGDLRARLETRLDASVPAWRMLDGVRAAVAALDRVRPEGMSPEATPSAVLQSVARSLPPGPSMTAHVRLSDRLQQATVDPRDVLRRIRSVDGRDPADAEGARPAPPAPDRAPADGVSAAYPARPWADGAVTRGKVNRRQDEANRGASEPAPPPMRPPLPSPSADAGQERMRVLESEVDRLVRTGEALVGKTGALTGYPRLPGVGHDDVPDPIGEHLRTVEEAEVEIVEMAGSAGVVAKLPRRMGPRPEAATSAAEEETGFSLQSQLDEASVEIVILDGGGAGKAT